MATEYRGYRYEIRELRERFQGTVWPPEAQRHAAGLIVVPYAATPAEAEKVVREWIDGQLGKNGGA